MSYAGLGQTSTAMMPAATVGRSTSRHEAGGAVRVPAAWAQRAANAGNRYNNPSAPLIAVDGRAGPVTIAALRTLSHQFSSDQPVTNDPPTSRVTDTVIIPVALETALAARRIAPDPPVSSATRMTTTRTTTTSGGGTTSTPVTEPVPGATPAATPADEVILDEGSSTGVRGLVARYGIWPWAIAGTALVGVGIWFLTGGGMRSNRRRRVRRNGGIDDAREDFAYAIRSARYFHKIGSREQTREYVSAAEQAAARVGPLSAAQQAALDGVRRLVANRRRRVSRNYSYEHTSHPYKYDTGGRPRPNGYRGAGFKRVPRVGTRVVFDPNPASLALYSSHPKLGEHGTVQTVAMGRGSSHHMRGPGGGLVYVDWDESRFQGVSLRDLSKAGR